MNTPPDPLAALGFAAAHGLDTSQSSDEYVADIRSGETDDLVVPLTPEVERRARWQAYARTTAAGRTSDELFAEARGENIDSDRPAADTP